MEARRPTATTASGKIRPLAASSAAEADGPEGRDAEDDRGHQGDGEALEQVGGHAGAVAHVVAHVVGDGGRVAGVVLGDAGLDLADQVGADVGGLGEDAAADPQEQGQQRAAEAEADEDRRGGVLEEHDDDGGAEQAEAGGEQAGHAAGAEGHLQGGRGSRSRRAAAAVRTLPRTASHMPMKPIEPGEDAARRRRRGCGTRRTGRSVRADRRRPGRRVALLISVDVTNTTTASGTTIMAMVRNWRFR